jgi:hypothetical protein
LSHSLVAPAKSDWDLFVVVKIIIGNLSIAGLQTEFVGIKDCFLYKRPDNAVPWFLSRYV